MEKVGKALEFNLPLPPSLNSLYRYGNGRYYMVKEGTDYKEWIYKTQRREPMNGYLRVTVRFHLIRDRDIDNGLKLLLDSLQNVAYHNDKQIALLSVTKTMDVEKKSFAHVLVESYSLPDNGRIAN